MSSVSPLVVYEPPASFLMLTAVAAWVVSVYLHTLVTLSPSTPYERLQSKSEGFKFQGGETWHVVNSSFRLTICCLISIENSPMAYSFISLVTVTKLMLIVHV